MYLQVNSKLDYSKSEWGVANNVEIISKYMERASFWCKFCHDSIIKINLTVYVNKAKYGTAKDSVFSCFQPAQPVGEQTSPDHSSL